MPDNRFIQGFLNVLHFANEHGEVNTRDLEGCASDGSQAFVLDHGGRVGPATLVWAVQHVIAVAASIPGSSSMQPDSATNQPTFGHYLPVVIAAIEAMEF